MVELVVELKAELGVEPAYGLTGAAPVRLTAVVSVVLDAKPDTELVARLAEEIEAEPAY